MSDSLALTPKNFSHRIALLKQGEHLCSVYGDTGELLTQAMPYIKAGLLNGERCIYVADQHSKETIVQALKFWGVHADHEMSTGRLVFWTRHEYRQPGLFDLNTMLDFVNRTLSQAVADGHTGIRLAVEMSWTVNNEISDDDLVRWEDFINTISFPGSKISFICQYNRHLLPCPLIAKAVQVHPVVILGEDICPNSHYRPASDVLTVQDSHSLDGLLSEITAPHRLQTRLGAGSKSTTV
ncbi:MAG: MEDS domain-containing protein [Nitrospirales bacterium]|nr:MEDS domain-containing protein [Nitrospirales bacterium]